MRHLICLAIVCFVLFNPVLAQQSWCGQQMLYFQQANVADPVSGYEELINFPSGNPTEDDNVTITSASGPVLIDAYIMPQGALQNVIQLNAGLRTFTTYHYVSTAVGTTRINFTAFQRFLNGTEVVFYSQLTEDINALTPQMYITNRVSPTNLKVNPTDQLGIKVYAQTDHPSPVTVHFLYQGTENVSHFMSGFFDCAGMTGQPDNGPAIMAGLGILGGILGALIIIRRKE